MYKLQVTIFRVPYICLKEFENIFLKSRRVHVKYSKTKSYIKSYKMFFTFKVGFFFIVKCEKIQQKIQENNV